MSDSTEVLARAAAGDPAAWRELVSRYQRLVYATVRQFRLSTADAEDVFQEAFVRLHRHAGRMRESRALTRWLIVTTRNLCLDHLAREGRRHQAIQRLDPPAPFEHDFEAVDRIERAQWVREALADLGERCRKLLWILYFEQELPDYRAAAEKLGMPIGSIGPTRARCFAQLMKRLHQGALGEEM